LDLHVAPSFSLCSNDGRRIKAYPGLDIRRMRPPDIKHFPSSGGANAGD